MGFFVDGLRDGFRGRKLWPATALVSAAIALAALIATSGTPLIAQVTRFAGPLSSQPLALSANAPAGGTLGSGGHGPGARHHGPIRPREP